VDTASSDSFWLIVIIAWVFFGFIGAAIGSSKGLGGTGFILGLLLGPIGILIVAVMSPTPEAQARRDAEVAGATHSLGGSMQLRPCPWCAEQIQPAAVVCRYCGRDVQPIAVATAEGWFRDPSGRHPDRWWDGSAWTQWVRDKPGGTRAEDPPLLSPPPQAEAGESWRTDPSGRYPDRWWDGKRWTNWVRDKPGGTRSEDPPTLSPPVG
jgi:hypothetical protein